MTIKQRTQRQTAPWRSWWNLSGRYGRRLGRPLPFYIDYIMNKSWEELSIPDKREIRRVWAMYMNYIAVGDGYAWRDDHWFKSDERYSEPINWN